MGGVRWVGPLGGSVMGRHCEFHQFFQHFAKMRSQIRFFPFFLDSIMLAANIAVFTASCIPFIGTVTFCLSLVVKMSTQPEDSPVASTEIASSGIAKSLLVGGCNLDAFSKTDTGWSPL